MTEYIFVQDEMDHDEVHMYVRDEATSHLYCAGTINIDIISQMLSKEQVLSIQKGNSLYLYGTFTYQGHIKKDF